MIGYLLICYVDTEKVSHSKKKVDEIVSMINMSDKFEVENSFLIKDSIQTIIECFKWNSSSYLNDPDGLIDPDFDDEDDEDDSFTNPNQNTFGDSKHEYPSDMVCLYISFVGSLELYNIFCELSDEIETSELDEYYTHFYELSSIDQMEIFRRLLNPESENDKTDKIIHKEGVKKIEEIREFLRNHKN